MRKSSLAVASLLSLGGLVLGAALAVGPLPGKAALAAAGDMLVVTGDAVNVRLGPSTNTRIRQRVGRDQQVMELQREGDWLRVEVVDGEGREGWIHGSLLAPPGGAPLAAAPDAAEPSERAAASPPADATVAAAPARPEQAPAVPEQPPADGEEAVARTTEDVATAPGDVAVIAPNAATSRPAVGVPAQPATDAPQTIEPAAAPVRDVTAELDRFRESVAYLNSRALTVAGVDLFTDVESAGGGVVQVAATEAWSTIPPAGQQSYANTLLDRWAAARGYGGRVSVQIVDADGQVLLESSKP